MAADNRRQLALLAILLVVLAGALWYAWRQRPVGLEPGTSAAAGSQTPGDAAAPTPSRPVADVDLERLDHHPALPDARERNPFRFGRRAPPPSVDPVERPGPPVPFPAGETVGSTRPAGPPPIPLKFIGLVEAQGQTTRLAVLSDGRNVFHGREGDIIDGRYRIIRIGVESIEVAHVDGRGQQVIRLSGAG